MVEIKTPFLFFSQLINGVPKPWKYFKIDGLMVNAYEILSKNSTNKAIRKQGVHAYLNFNGIITIDSGGFLFMKKKNLDIHPQEILELYKQSKPNFGVVLDYPLNTNLSRKEIRRRQIITLKNIKYMVENYNRRNPELIPVIHGNTIKSVQWYLKKLEEINDFNIYGIGSLVPSVFTSKGAGGIYNVIEIIAFVKSQLPNKKIHVFGVGSALTMHLMFYAGANSVDSTGWRTKAAFGAIQLPGIGDRYITPNKKHAKYPNLSKEEKKILNQCACPICKKFTLKELIQSFKYRAIHNSWVFQRELVIARKLLKENEEEYEKYVEKILNRTKFYKAFKFIKKMKLKYSL
ncbi:MAG: tRNA-guanine transglycosylase [Candidatus Aenigmatarchaeota archaeon]